MPLGHPGMAEWQPFGQGNRLLHSCLVTISKGLPSINSKPQNLFYLFQLAPTSASCVPSPRAYSGILPQTPKSPHLQAHLLNSIKHPVSSTPKSD